MQHFLQLRKLSRAARKAFADGMLCRPDLERGNNQRKLHLKARQQVSLTQKARHHCDIEIEVGKREQKREVCSTREGRIVGNMIKPS